MLSIQATAASITAITSLAVALVTAGLGYLAKRRSDDGLARLNHLLEDKRAERDARRDYEYEARKHLYTELQPLLFQHAELCESAYNRIVGIARYSRAGPLFEEEETLLLRDYYLQSTIFRLFAPVAVFKLIQARLTGVDVAVEPRIRAHYALAKHLFFAWNAGYKLAAASPSLSYSPAQPDAEELRRSEPAIYRQQHVWIGRLEQLARALTVQESDGRQRPMSYGEFEEKFRHRESGLFQAVQPIIELMRGFHPLTAPVLWRLFLAQAHLNLAVLRCFYGGDQAAHLTECMSEEDKLRFDWRAPKSTVAREDAIDHNFSAVRRYLEESYSDAFVKWS